MKKTTLHLSFGDVYAYISRETGKWHATNFGIERATLTELTAECERIYYKPTSETSNQEYQAQYAYACGYHD